MEGELEDGLEGEAEGGALWSFFSSTAVPVVLLVLLLSL